jgi:Leucine-rich repeat (LRR) protein
MNDAARHEGYGTDEKPRVDRINPDQEDALRQIAMLFPRGRRNTPTGTVHCGTDREGWVTSLLIINAEGSYGKKRTLALPPQLRRIKSFTYERDPSLEELSIPDACTDLVSVQCAFDGLRVLRLPSDLSQLRSLRCGCNQLTELHLETATGLEYLSIAHNVIGNLYLPRSMPRLSFLAYHNNPLPHEMMRQLEPRS